MVELNQLIFILTTTLTIAVVGYVTMQIYEVHEQTYGQVAKRVIRKTIRKIRG